LRYYNRKIGGGQVKKEISSKDPGTEGVQRIQEIRGRISAMDLICPGTLLERTKTCGKPNCRCAKDPDARHGPYYEWTWFEEGRLVHKTVSRAQAEIIKKAIGNYREIKSLFDRWKAETKAIILGMRNRNR
jgi:hypothetical protein